MAATISEFMGHDHDRLDEIFKQFQEAEQENPDKAKPLFKEFLTGLQRHIVWEEDILFPVFEQHADMTQGYGPTTVMRLEHRQIKEFLDRIHDRVASGQRAEDTAERGLLEVLGMHNVKEERVLYPWLDSMLGDHERAKLIEQMQQLPPERYEACCT